MREPHDVKLVIFDLDGTLVDTSGDIAAAVNAVLGELGRDPLPEETILGYVGDGSRELLRRCLGDVADPREAASRFRRIYRESPCTRSRLYPGVRRILDAHVDLPMAIVTNKPLEIALPILQGLGMASSFDPILGERSVPRNKPAPDGVRFVLEAHGVPSSRAILVGDGPQDVGAGRAAGVFTVAALYGFNPGDRLIAASPDATLDEFGGLARYLGDGGRDPVARCNPGRPFD
jgi:phosphoglycolate phosphatase